MKKLAIAVAAVACASVVMAQTVTSQNIVGYTKITATGGGDLTMGALNFNANSATVGELFDALPSESSVYIWNKGTGNYIIAGKDKRGNWDANGSTVLAGGDAFWIEPGGVGSTEIVLPGEVLVDQALIDVPAGIVMTGYYYPVQKSLQTTQLADDIPNDSSVYFWDSGTQGYIIASKDKRGNWDANPLITPAAGFWVESASAFVSTNDVPFTP